MGDDSGGGAWAMTVMVIVMCKLWQWQQQQRWGNSSYLVFAVASIFSNFSVIDS